jgi:nucleoid DNA-binding protein
VKDNAKEKRTKKEIVKLIAEDAELPQLKTKAIVQATFDAIIDTLCTEGRIELRNFGVFEVKQRKSRKARNPKTGDPVHVGPKNVVTFKPGKIMEERVSKMTVLPHLEKAKKRKKAKAEQQANGAEEHAGEEVLAGGHKAT